MYAHLKTILTCTPSLKSHYKINPYTNSKYKHPNTNSQRGNPVSIAFVNNVYITNYKASIVDHSLWLTDTRLTISLSDHWKTTRESATFEVLKPFCFLFRISVWKDFLSKCTSLKLDLLYDCEIDCFQPRNVTSWGREGVKEKHKKGMETKYKFNYWQKHWPRVVRISTTTCGVLSFKNRIQLLTKKFF